MFSGFIEDTSNTPSSQGLLAFSALRHFSGEPRVLDKPAQLPLPSAHLNAYLISMSDGVVFEGRDVLNTMIASNVASFVQIRK